MSTASPRPRFGPGTRAVVACLVVAHLVAGARAWQAGLVDDGWTAFVAARPERALIHAGASYAPFVADGAWWRLLSSGLVHGDALHLLSNVIWLLAGGLVLEPSVGAWRQGLVVWLGVIAGAALAFVSGLPLTAGASGGVLALLGYLAVAPPGSGDATRIRRGAVALAAGLVVASMILPSANTPAHVGGLVSGALYGVVSRERAPSRGEAALAAALTVCAALGVCGLLGP